MRSTASVIFYSTEFLQVLREFKFAITAPVLIYEDNQSTIKLVENPVFHKKSKHVDIKYH